MNRIYLFGKIAFKSRLRYTFWPKLKVYMELVIETCSGDKFECIIFEEQCDVLRNINLGNYVYVEGVGKISVNKFKVCINKLYY